MSKTRLLTPALLTVLFLLLSTVSPAFAANPPNPGDVLINEYVANNATEWVELYNTTASDLDISGFYIDDIAGGGGAPKVIPASTIISAGGYYVMTFSSFLNNGGDDVRFIDPTQTVIHDSTSYTTATASYSWYRAPDGGAWSPTESSTPTQGAANPGGGPTINPGDVLVNEYVANSPTEWVELYNTTGSSLDISGYYIDDIAGGGGAPQAIPSGTTIPADGFYTMDLSSFLNNGGDDVRFLDPTQTTIIDSTSYAFSTTEYAWYRVTDGGAWSAEETDSPTKNASNTPPAALGDVVINEFVANATTEWVELYNTTLQTKDISGYYIDDIAAGGGSPIVIPADTVIQPGGFYVLQFAGFLNNGGDDVRFLDPTQTIILDSYTYPSANADNAWYRYPDGGAWAALETSTLSPGASNPGTGDTPWTPGNFEIHIFDVEQGDSQLIIFPSGFTILIDVREASWNTGAGAALIASKIQSITGGTHINVGVLSHHHLDHIGYAGYGGIWGLIETHGITFDKIVDRNAGAWVDGFGGGAVNGECDPDLEIQWYNVGTQSGTSRNWLCYATNPANTNIYPIRELAQLSSTTQIDPPDAGALVTIVQVDANGVMMADGITPLQGDHSTDAVPPSENDYSIALKIRYGTIDYATAGDSDGEYAISTFGYTYNNVEGVLAPLYGQVDILRANHHGSQHSTSQFYVDTLNPDASAISCGNNTYGHPGQGVLDRLLGTGDVYLTNLCDATRNYGAAVIVNGDILIQSSDGVNYTVNGTAYVASDPSVPTPTATIPPTATPTATPLPPTSTPTALPSDHVGDLDGSTTPANGGKWNATITITVEDATHSPVVNATVSGAWSAGASGSGSCVTNGSGQCTITKNNISKNSSSATFTVTDVTHATYTYTSGDNHDPDGDSNGTAITVTKP
jgi:beta-lactamase superfamily II metal-dependent hydrolase